MPGSWRQHDHPHLTHENCQETSPAVNRYNCLAWAAGEDFRWWWPDQRGYAYWPAGVPRAESLPAFIAAFRTLGYEVCDNADLEPGLQKVAIYGQPGYDGRIVPTHASKQLSNGKWSSKMGALEDISHDDVESVDGPVYGHAICFMSRRHVE